MKNKFNKKKITELKDNPDQSTNKYDEPYLNNLIDKATDKWSKITDKDAWLRELRGSD